MEADRGLVEDVEDPDQTRADLRRQPDPLPLAARERRGGAVEGQVVEPDVPQEPQALADLLEHPARDGLLTLTEDERLEEPSGLLDRERADLPDRAAAEPHGQALRPQPASPAGGTRPLRHEALDLEPRLLGGRLLVPSLEHRHHPVEPAVLAGPVEDELPRRFGQLAPRLVQAEPAAAREDLERLLEVDGFPPRPGRERAPMQRLARIGHHEVGIQLEPRPEAPALRASAVRVVEGEHPGRDLGEGHAAARARQPLGEDERLAAFHGLDDRDALGELEGGLERIGQPRPDRVLDDETVHDHLDRVLLVLVELNLLGELAQGPVDADAAVPLPAEVEEELPVLPLPAADHGRQDHDPGPSGQREDAIHHLLHGLRRNDLAALRAVRRTHARVEDPQVVVDLGHRADGGAWVLGGRLLLDRDRRREPLDRVDVGLLHLLQELPGVGGEALDVAALPLGVDRVEGQRGLPGPGEPRDHDKPVAGDLEVDVLEVVLARAPDDDAVTSHGHTAVPAAPSILPELPA